MVKLRKRKSQVSDLDDEVTLVDEVTELRGMLKELTVQMARLDRQREKDREEMKAMLESLKLNSNNAAVNTGSPEPQGAKALTSANMSPSTGAIPKRTEPRPSVRESSPPALTPITPHLTQTRFVLENAGSSSSRPQVTPRTLFTPPVVQPRAAPQPTYVVLSDRDGITKFRAEAPASQPLRRNQEVEGWLRQIENTIKPATDEALIRAAKAHCRGQADVIINSPIFDEIYTWAEFRQKIRQKFRGTCSASDFFTLLYEIRMMAGQAPLDFHTTLEGMVYQGYRDHREAVGNPEELIRRVFLQGLPGWLRELLALKEGDSVQSLVETAQRLWNARVGIRNDDEPPKLPAAPRRGEISEVSRIPPRPIRRRDQHSALVCWGCRREGHFRRECPFQNIQNGEAPAISGYRRSQNRVHFRRPHEYASRQTTIDRGCGPDSDLE